MEAAAAAVMETAVVVGCKQGNATEMLRCLAGTIRLCNHSVTGPCIHSRHLCDVLNVTWRRPTWVAVGAAAVMEMVEGGDEAGCRQGMQ